MKCDSHELLIYIRMLIENLNLEIKIKQIKS